MQGARPHSPASAASRLAQHWPARPQLAQPGPLNPNKPLWSLQAEYEELAVGLGLDHARREGLRARLKAVRMTCPLFDTAQWVRDLEKVRALPHTEV